MSKHETPMTRWYWKQVGGTLVEEFPAVSRAPGRGQRLIDGIILPAGPNVIARASEVDLAGQEVICVQAKASRLGMYLMGQTLFSAKLIERFNPRSVVSVALCSEDDDVLRPLLEVYPGMKVVVCPADVTFASLVVQEQCDIGGG